jgi:transcriptional regulator with XRE-family HTH domain
MSRRPTIRDVAERAGVSIATVSRVLNDRADVSVETRERVREVARSVGYTADPAARGLVTQRTQLVAVVVGDNAGHRDLSLLFFGKVMAAVSRRLARADYDSLLLQPLDLGVHHRFDAAILIGIDGNDGLITDLSRAASLRRGGLCGSADRAAQSSAPTTQRGFGSRSGICTSSATAALRTSPARGTPSRAPTASAPFSAKLGSSHSSCRTNTSTRRTSPQTAATRRPLSCSPSTSVPLRSVAASDLMALAALQAIRDAGLEPAATSPSSASTTSRLQPWRIRR